MRIILDPGHGGTDPGACANDLREADLNIDIANRIKAKLSFYEAEVIIGPRYDDLSERAAYANNLNADYFLSIHCNAGGGTGFESYVHDYASKESHRIRGVIHDAVVGGYLEQQGVKDRGKKKANFAVLRETHMPAALLECLFVDNEQDAAKLKDDRFLNGLANEIAYGLAVALKLQRKPESPGCPTCKKLLLEIANMKADMEKMAAICKVLEKYNAR